VVICTVASVAVGAEEVDLKTLLPKWEPSFSVRVGGGYRDNVTLASSAPESSPFFRSGLELAAFHPPWKGTEITLFLDAEDTRYFSSRTVNDEQTVFAQGEIKHHWLNDWQAGIAVEGSYQNQVVDIAVNDLIGTVISPTNHAIQVRGESVAARPSVRRNLSEKVWLAFEFPVTRQFFDLPLDDHWEGGPSITYGVAYGYRSEVTFTYDYLYRDYDTAPLRTRTGDPIPETRTVDQHEFRWVWKHHWDEDRHWRTTVKAGYRDSSDNGSGYFDYDRVSVSTALRWRKHPWEITTEARYAHFEFPVQTVGSLLLNGDPRKRRRSDWTVHFRVERQLVPHLRGFAEYDREQSISNVSIEEYTVNTVSGGLVVEY
jgi:hypothetical protein